jgi:hypothetical protein
MTWDLFSCTYLQGGHTWQCADDFEIRGDAQFIDQRSVGNELLGTFNTQLYGAGSPQAMPTPCSPWSLTIRPLERPSATLSVGIPPSTR